MKEIEKRFENIDDNTLDNVVGGASQNGEELTVGEIISLTNGKINIRKNDCFEKGDWIYMSPVNYDDVHGMKNIRLNVYYKNGEAYMNSGYLGNFLNGAKYVGNNIFAK